MRGIPTASFCQRVAVLLGAAVVIPAHQVVGQRPTVRIPTVSRVDTGAIPPQRIVRRPALPFVPFDTIDTRSGRPLNMDTIVVINGHRMTRREYFRQANDLERAATAKGFTFHTAATDPIKVQQIVPNPTLLRSQIDRFRNAKVGPPRVILLSERHRRLTNLAQLRRASTAQLGALDPAILASIQHRTAWIHIDPAIALNSKTWSDNFDLGDQDLLAARFGYSATLAGDTSKTKLDASAYADVWVFNAHGRVADIDFVSESPVSGSSSGQVDVSVLGSSRYTHSLGASSSFETDVNEDIDYSVSAKFPVGPFDVTARVGGQGSIGASFGIGAANGAVSGDVTPYLDLAGYGEASIGIWIVDVGVGGKLTLIKLGLPIVGRVVLVQPSGEAFSGLNRELDVNYDVDALSGSLYAFAQVTHPCVPKFWNDCTSKWEHDIWSWGGITDSGQFAHFQDFIDLGTGTTSTIRVINAYVNGTVNLVGASTLTFVARDSVSGAPLSGTVDAGLFIQVPTNVPATKSFACMVEPGARSPQTTATRLQ